ERRGDGGLDLPATDVAVHQLAFAVDYEHAGNRLDIVAPGQGAIKPALAFLVEENLRPRFGMGFQELHEARTLHVEADADHLEAVAVVLIVDRPHIRQLGNARPAPAGPEIHEHDLAAVLGQVEATAIEGGADHVDRLPDEGLHFAAVSGRDRAFSEIARQDHTHKHAK